MKKYRIKKEAEQFFCESYRGQVQPLEWFVSRNISKKALDEIEDVVISYGWENEGYTDIHGWGCRDGSRVHFTIKFPQSSHDEYKNIKEKFRGMTGEMQKVVDKWYNENK